MTSQHRPAPTSPRHQLPSAVRPPTHDSSPDLRALIRRRLLDAYAEARLDEAARMLALDALRIGEPALAPAEERAWLAATLELSGRTVSDCAVEALAAILARRLEEAPQTVRRRIARNAAWRGPGT
jgi:hypothetical protein